MGPPQATLEVLAAGSCLCYLTTLNNSEKDTNSEMSMTINRAIEFLWESCSCLRETHPGLGWNTGQERWGGSWGWAQLAHLKGLSGSCQGNWTTTCEPKLSLGRWRGGRGSGVCDFCPKHIFQKWFPLLHILRWGIDMQLIRCEPLWIMWVNHLWTNMGTEKRKNVEPLSRALSPINHRDKVPHAPAASDRFPRR